MTTATVPMDETWNLADLYLDDATYRAARKDLEQTLPGLDAWQGRLTESAETLAEALGAISDSARAFGRLRCYTALKSDGDTRNAANQAMRQEVDLLATRFSEVTSYLSPEILAADPKTIAAFIENETRLESHAQYLNDLIRLRAHVLSPPEERIMAAAGMITSDPHSLFELLHNGDLPRIEVTLHDGSSVRVAPVNFMKHRVSHHRDDRQLVTKAYFNSFAAMRSSLGQNLFASVKTHLFRSRTRGYDSCLSSALAAENIPTEVYRNLIRRVREKLPLFHRYLRLRAKALNVESLELHDLYPPIIDRPTQPYSTTDAMRMVTDGLAPLGQEYVQELKSGLQSRWIDWHATDGKRSGAYATGSAYDVHPYVLLNFIGDYDGVSTLAHEMGHAMHSFFSNREQPYAVANYSIFVAEVASTLNEALVAHHALDLAQDRETRIGLLSRQLESIRGTLFRQTMFAEFELEIHARAERGESLTGESMDELYLRLTREYHGHDEGVLHVADHHAVEWAAIPHFHYNFYVYQYATGIVAALALAEGILSGQDAPREQYLRFLRSGGSDYPLAVLRRAGVDLETAEPYDAAMIKVERNLDELEQLLDGD